MATPRLEPARLLPLFVYGTLADPDFVARLLEHPVRRESACLLDHALLPDPVLPWPTLFPAPGSETEGWIYRDLDAEDFRRLDHYEGVGEGLYRRVPARATQGETTGVAVEVHVYLMSGVPFPAP